MASPTRDILVNQLGLDADAYEQAKRKAAEARITLMHAVEQLNVLAEDAVLEGFSKLYKTQFAKLQDMEIPAAIINLVPKDLAQKFRIIPIDRAGNNVIAAMGDPTNLQAIDAVRFRTGYTIRPVLASEKRITESLEKYYGNKLDINTEKLDKDQPQTKKNAIADAQRTVIGKGGSDKDGPVIKLVNEILIQCLERRASDIHIEPYEQILRVRLRIDGALHEIARPPIGMRDPLISRIKIMAALNIAEKRLPQDGGIRVTIADKPVDFRVSSLPTIYGEKIVMRILDKSALKVDMTQLGFETDDLAKFKEAIHRPFGMVLVTGPTGSGKTTTLYSALAELNKETENIMTAEDPVEYNLEGINQVQMRPDIDLTFAAALRSFLRQDPDVIMVGEVRDLETAEIAIKAALTGHLVLSTLHTNSAADTISRMLNMGVEGFNLVSALNAVVAQRLVRRICPKCKIPDEAVTPEVLVQLGIHPNYTSKIKTFKGKGCPECNYSGNKGRVAVHEVMLLNDTIRDAILKGQAAMQIKRAAIATGMRTLRQSALNKMVQGICSAIEVTKNTAPDTDDNKKSAAA